MSLQPWFVEMLVCPKSKKPLIYFSEEQFLFCPESRLKYRIEDEVPVLLPEEGELMDEAQTSALLARAKELGLSSS